MILNPCLKNREFFESFIIKVIWYFAKNAIQRAIVSKNKDEFFTSGYILSSTGGNDELSEIMNNDLKDLHNWIKFEKYYEDRNNKEEWLWEEQNIKGGL